MTASADFRKDPLSLFSVRGKVAIVTGAAGAFGALAVQAPAGAGAKVAFTGHVFDADGGYTAG